MESATYVPGRLTTDESMNNVLSGIQLSAMIELHHNNAAIKFLFLPYMAMGEEVIAALRMHPEVVIIAQSNHDNRVGEYQE